MGRDARLDHRHRDEPPRFDLEVRVVGASGPSDLSCLCAPYCRRYRSAAR